MESKLNLRLFPRLRCERFLSCLSVDPDVVWSFINTAADAGTYAIEYYGLASRVLV